MFDFLNDNPGVLPNLLEEIETAKKLKGARVHDPENDPEDPDVELLPQTS